MIRHVTAPTPRAWLAGLSLLAACTSSCTMTEDTTRPVASPEWSGHADAFGFIPRDHPGLRIVVSGPSTARYMPEVLGVGVLPVTMRVKNVSSEDAVMPRTRLAFRAVRQGVAFPCSDESRPFPRDHEPSIVKAGATVVLSRDLVCSMPVTGRYELSSHVRFDGNDRAEEMGAFVTHVTAISPRGPIPYPERPGLFVALSGRSSVRAPRVPVDDSAAVPYEALVAFTNTRALALPLGAIHAAVRIEKEGVVVPCPRDAADIWTHAPDSVAPGQTVIVRVSVPCNLPLDAGYDLVAWTTLGDGPVGEGSQLGPLRFTVTRAPYTPSDDYPDLARSVGAGLLPSAR
jgi:hypothetical protein